MGLLDLARGALRGTTADYLGGPVDAYNTAIGLLAPEASGNIYAATIRQALPEPIQTGTSDWWAQKMGLPQGQGMMYETGRMIAPSPRGLLTAARNVPIQELITYHGTPHRFPATEANPLGEFDASKIGSGEGAQAYGHGIYLAENPETAINYSKEIPYKDFQKKVSEVYSQYNSPDEAVAALKEAGLSDAQMQVMKALEKDDWLGFDYPHQALRAALKEPQNFDLSSETKSALQEMSSVYKVDLPDEMIDRMLDWDKPLSEQPAVFKELMKITDLTGTAGFLAKSPEKTTFGKLYNALKNQNSQSDVSEYFRKGGIPGIKYLDQGSRNAGKGTRNFVVFPGEEKKVKILKRD